MAPRRGDVYTCILEPVVGSEQRGTRPVIVVGNDAFNAALPLVAVVPVTTFRRRSGSIYPSEAIVPKGAGGIRVESIALCQQVRTVARQRVGRRIGALPADVLSAVEDALTVHLALRRA